MIRRYTVVETSLNRVEFRWKWLRFLQRTFALGSVLVSLVLMLGVSILLGWVTDKALVIACFVFIAAAGFIAWAITAIAVAAGTHERSWLASAVERVDK